MTAHPIRDVLRADRSGFEAVSPRLGAAVSRLKRKNALPYAEFVS